MHKGKHWLNSNPHASGCKIGRRTIGSVIEDFLLSIISTEEGCVISFGHFISVSCCFAVRMVGILTRECTRAQKRGCAAGSEQSGASRTE